jgi:hypothetical protein
MKTVGRSRSVATTDFCKFDAMMSSTGVPVCDIVDLPFPVGSVKVGFGDPIAVVVLRLSRNHGCAEVEIRRTPAATSMVFLESRLRIAKLDHFEGASTNSVLRIVRVRFSGFSLRMPPSRNCDGPAEVFGRPDCWSSGTASSRRLRHEAITTMPAKVTTA